jgi:hypothetical protein
VYVSVGTNNGNHKRGKREAVTADDATDSTSEEAREGSESEGMREVINFLVCKNFTTRNLTYLKNIFFLLTHLDEGIQAFLHTLLFLIFYYGI